MTKVSSKEGSNMRKVIVIPPTKSHEERSVQPVLTKASRTVAYCRSSNEEEERQNSYEIQKRYYKEFIEKRHGWEFVGVYGDGGKQGVDPNGDTGLAKLLNDAKEGRYDKVVMNPQFSLGRSIEETMEIQNTLMDQGIGIMYEIDGKLLTSRRFRSMMRMIDKGECPSLPDNHLL